MFVLYLNMMRDRSESRVPVACADTPEALEEYVRSLRVPDYRDGQYLKVFRAGSLLEWFNPPEWSGSTGVFDVGDEDQAAEHARTLFRNFIQSLPRA